jgi:hypothetical protein
MRIGNWTIATNLTREGTVLLPRFLAEGGQSDEAFLQAKICQDQ